MLKAENLISKQRYYIVTGVVIFLMLILLSRFFYLQIFRYEKYKHKAEINRIRAVTVNAPRGLILDRNGNILVDNYPTYILTAIPGEMEQKEKIFNSISQCTGIDSLIIAENFSKYYRAKFVPTRLMKDLTFHQISILEENILDLPGVNYKQFPERYYPSRINGSHFLGYLKEVDKPVQEKLGNPNVYELGDLIGWSGLEKFYESQLKGTRGVKYLEVDALGREMEEVKGYNNRRSEPGADIRLMIDADLQLLMEEKMKDYRGIAVLSNPKTGEILAYVSKPDYPPNIFTGKMLKDDWNEVRNDPHRPLIDRVITGLYPPGSTFKIITALALLEENLLDPSKEVECNGSYQFGDRTFHCWNETGHGSVSLQAGIAQSCNIYFYQMVQKLSLSQWADNCFDFGFGQETGIDLPYEKTGVIPTEKYMNRKYGKWGWSRGNLLNLALGQGDILVTPIQMVQFINQIATHGNAERLHFVKKDNEEKGIRPQYSDNTWNKIEKYLLSTVTDNQGTGRSADPKIKGLIIGGKTGTAENPHGDPHAWFIGFGKKDNQILTTVILVENGGHGGEIAAPIARNAYSRYFLPIKQSQIVLKTP